MKFLLLLCLATTNIHAGLRSINPDKTILPLIQIFSPQNVKVSDTQMEVRVSTYNKHGEISRGAGKLKVDLATYEKALKLSSAVYQMEPSRSWLSSNPTEKSYFGTAFHIGENLVLTNHHVLSPSRSNLTECGPFELFQNNRSETFSCKKVHFCNEEHDVCLIEMGPRKGKCHNFLCTKADMIEMEAGAALRLVESPKVDFTNMLTAPLTCIGNTMGYGIHYSQGKGYEMSGELIRFHAPLRSGNSGGPLLSEAGSVIGVVKRESPKKVGPESYNIAANMGLVIQMIRDQVRDEKVLEAFNKAVTK